MRKANSYTPFMKTLISTILFLFITTCFGQQQKQIIFKKADYPPSKFLLTTDTSKFGRVQIVRTLIKPKFSSNGFSCRSWLTIRNNDKILKHKFYEIEPVGGCSGLFLPSSQPLDNYFIISKFGDYEGETLLIDTAGKLTELLGGAFSISPDKKYLFSIWDSDLSGITVYDLTNKKAILKKETEGDQRYADIYFQDGKYYVSFDDDITIGHINLETKKITLSKRPKGFLKKASKLRIYNVVQTLPKCNCGRE